MVRVPQEVLKQRVQADIYPNAAVGLKTILSESGVGGLYKGYFATISRDVPWNALSFMFFSQFKNLFKQVTGKAPTNEENLALGASAVCIGRPCLWGLGAFGQEGVARVLSLLRAELIRIMQLCGTPRLTVKAPNGANGTM